jgi:hypothetical protein
MKRTVRPPEPVDVGNPQWIARAWQWVFDQLVHLDGCIDSLRAETTEKDATMFSMIAAGKDMDGTLADQIEAHQKFHDLMEAGHKAQRSQVQQAWLIAKDGARAAYDVGKFVAVIGVGKVLGFL